MGWPPPGGGSSSKSGDGPLLPILGIPWGSFPAEERLGRVGAAKTGGGCQNFQQWTKQTIARKYLGGDGAKSIHN